MTIGRLFTAYLANRMSLNSIMIGSAFLGIGVSVFIPLATTLTWFYALLAIAGLATACFWPTVLAEADAYLSVNTTILMVLLASMGMAGFGITPWGMGVVGDNAELKSAFAIIPALFAALILLLALERRMSKKASTTS